LITLLQEVGTIPQSMSPISGIKAAKAFDLILPFIQVHPYLGTGALVNVKVIFWEKNLNACFTKLKGSIKMQ
jgi:hypothetical protein